MSLSVAYNIARDGLASAALASSVVSRNVASADDPAAARKSTAVTVEAGGAVRLQSIVNAIDNALLERAIETSSEQSRLEVVAGALEQLGAIVGDPQAGASLPARIGDLRNALQTAAAAPHDEAAARQVLVAAGAIVTALNGAADLVGRVRTRAQADLAEGASRLTDLLADFAQVNGAILTGAAGRRDVTDAIDHRNALLREIAGLVDVRPALRDGNDMMLFLSSGATLFETSPRAITFDAGAPVVPGQPGPALCIDGIPLANAAAVGGRLGGLLEVRDRHAARLGTQLDEIARGLISATAEKDQSVPASLPDLAGLFTYAGGPALPPAGTATAGLAASIRLNANADPMAGGLLSRLRDGGIAAPGDPSYVYNSSGAAGFSGRLRELVEQLTASRAFDPAAGLGTADTGVLAFATASAGWLEGERSASSQRLEDKKVSSERALSAWQSRVGINVDEEMTTLIALQRSYQASSRLITTVGAMLDALLRATE
jgi:flagellar hook-associated protein 1 FlgK